MNQLAVHSITLESAPVYNIYCGHEFLMCPHAYAMLETYEIPCPVCFPMTDWSPLHAIMACLGRSTDVVPNVICKSCHTLACEQVRDLRKGE